MGISITHLLIVLLVVVLIFGTKRLKTIGEDLGGAVKNFKQSMRDGENAKAEGEAKQIAENRTVEGEAREKKD